MCTVVLSLAPAERMPLLLLGFRDEFTGRPWQPPARHWPGSPLIGGRDEQAGGTWLAVHPGIPRAACILNTRGQQAPPGSRRSRGELPLRAAADGSQTLEQLHDDEATLARYDPFILICADLTPATHALMLSWDGAHAALEHLGPATHVVTNAGHTFPSAHEDAKAAYFGAKFAAHRPDADPAATIKDAWGDWLTLADGDGLSDTDPAAIIVRHELPDGRVFGTTSVSLVALGAGGLRYDFQPVPADPTTWYSVDLGPSNRLAREGLRAGGIMASMPTVVAFNAHPDDEALFSGGTLARLAAEGNRVVIVVATEATGRRRDELRESAAILGAARVEHLGYANSGHGPLLYDDPPGRQRFVRADLDEAAQRLARILREEHADVLLSYDAAGGYGHRDHIKVHQVGARAAHLAGDVPVLEVTAPRELMTWPFWPVCLLRLVTTYRFDHPYTPRRAITHRVDVRRYAAVKQAAIAAYRSQMRSPAGYALTHMPAPLFRLLLGREWLAGPPVTML